MPALTSTATERIGALQHCMELADKHRALMADVQTPPFENRASLGASLDRLAHQHQHSELTMPMNLPVGISDMPMAEATQVLLSNLVTSPGSKDPPNSSPPTFENKALDAKKKVYSQQISNHSCRARRNLLCLLHGIRSLSMIFVVFTQKTNIHRSVAKSHFTVLLVEDLRVSQKLCMASLKKVGLALHLPSPPRLPSRARRYH